jgi:hypothetical protein
MEASHIIMYVGFMLAAYSVVGNDVIQTLGTFLSSNEKRPWYVLWAFAGSILAAVLILGYSGAGAFLGGDDIAYDRLDKIDIPAVLSWWYLLPPLVLLLITRIGIPVSTTFLILTFFSYKSLPSMVEKSLMGYVVAFVAGGFIYLLITKLTEKRFMELPLNKPGDKSLWTNSNFWIVAQWMATAFLWTQWLTQDLANIYVYLAVKNPVTGSPELSLPTFIFSLVVLVGLLGYIFYSKGGAIQKIVKSKTNTADIRSATFVDLIYGVVLYAFKYDSLGLWGGKVPMSTTWVFIGLLAGREIAMRFRLDGKPSMATLKDVGFDLGKVILGLLISIGLVLLMKTVSG